MRRCCSLASLFVMVAAFAGVQAFADSGTSGQIAAGTGPLPEPYRAEEFPDWLRPIARFEIIAVGSLPIAYFFSSVGFDLGRYASHSFDAHYAPWPLKNEFSYRPSNGEQLMALFTAIGCSLGIATVDLLLTQVFGVHRTTTVGGPER